MPERMRLDLKRIYAKRIRSTRANVFIKYGRVKPLYERFSENIRSIYRHIRWALVSVDGDAVSRMMDDPNIKAIIPDERVTFDSTVGAPAYIIPDTRSRMMKYYRVSEDFDEVEAGEDVDVAIIDTGIDTANDELMSLVVSVADDDVKDEVGHGTAVASAILQFTSPRLHIYKIFKSGRKPRMSDLVDALEWCRRERVNAVNISLGARIPMPSVNPVSDEVDYLYKRHGITSIVSAGNNGPAMFTVSTPAVSKTAITVGATYYDGRIAEFSSRGSTLDFVPKPDVVGWGVHLKLLRADNLNTLVVIGERQVLVSGTSFSAPQITGIYAILYGITGDPTKARESLYASAEVPQLVFGHSVDTSFVDVPEILVDEVGPMFYSGGYETKLLSVVSREGVIRNTYGRGIPDLGKAIRLARG